jgi:hypothetical protein
MNIKHAYFEVSDVNEEKIRNWGKDCPCIKWNRSWLNYILPLIEK